jgi:hypothetical protein
LFINLSSTSFLPLQATLMLCILDLATVNVDAQQSLIINNIYQTLSGYDVNAYSQPISTILMSLPEVASSICQYTCTFTANCVFVVLRSNNTCSTYANSARTSVYAESTSTIYEKQLTDGYLLNLSDYFSLTEVLFSELFFFNTNRTFLTLALGPSYRPLTGYISQNAFANNSLGSFSCSDPVVCINLCTANSSCGLATYQNATQKCQLTSANMTGQILVSSSNGTVYQKQASGYSFFFFDNLR